MSNPFNFRNAMLEDYRRISDFLTFEYFIHRHLDWRIPLDWLGQQPFLLIEKNSEIMAVMAAPNEVPAAAWIRLYACSALLDRRTIFLELLDKTRSQLPESVTHIYALGIENWFAKILDNSPFQLLQEIIVYACQVNASYGHHLPQGYFIRALQPEDIPQVTIVDHHCFPPLWQLSTESMQLAYLQSSYASVMVHDQEIIAYQITTEGLSSAHLARIAVTPTYQKRGLASTLLNDLFAHFAKKGIEQITVNTQSDNFASQALYRNFGFQLLPERYPVYALVIQ